MIDPQEQAMARYEELHGHFGRVQRESLLEAARSEEQMSRVSRDPIGHHSEPGKDHRTRANRNAVASVLREYFAGILDRDKLNKPVERSESRTGAELADRVTSRFEIASALNLLHGQDRELWFYVVRHYRDGLTREQIAERWHKSPRTVKVAIEAGLDVMIERLWVD
jgi:hypothetical protein